MITSANNQEKYSVSILIVTHQKGQRMDIQENQGDRKINFTMLKSDTELDEKLSFVHLIRMKFNGAVDKCGWFHFEGNNTYIEITLTFPDWSALSNARIHCNQFLDDNGSVVSSYKGAVTYADPNYVTGRELKVQALKNRLYT